MVDALPEEHDAAASGDDALPSPAVGAGGVNGGITSRLRLLVPRKLAERELAAHLKVGAAIGGQRVRYPEDLEQARKERQEWVLRTGELLGRLFNSDEVAERCNDWTGPILPEFSELRAFVDAFAAEMRHRVGRLNDVIKSLPGIPEPLPPKPIQVVPTSEHVAAARERERLTQQLKQVKQQQEQRPKVVIPPAAAVVSNVTESGATTVPTDAAAGATEGTPMEQAVTMMQQPGQETVRANGQATVAGTGGVLVVRTPDDPARGPVAQLLAQLGLTVVVAEGAGVVEALDKHRAAAFAVVLLGSDTGPLARSAEWLFDLGCCVGRLGGGRVCTVAGGPPPVEVRGVPHVLLDGGDGWHLQLARQLKRGGVSVDLNRLA